jgi:hypothetical protein
MIKSLSKQEYDLLSTFAIKNRKVITVKDVKASFNFSEGKIRVMLHRLEKKGWLERIEKGKYLIVPLEGRAGWAEHPFIPLSKLITNYYVSYLMPHFQRHNCYSGLRCSKDAHNPYRLQSSTSDFAIAQIRASGRILTLIFKQYTKLYKLEI